jgi:triacylglycerol esterase/lipase EstA (alpha/beta hydrolase family)
VFVHGTGDSIIGDTWRNNGFRMTIEEFLRRGYTEAELYGSAWGWGDYYHEYQHVYQQEYVVYIRKFIEAVMEYTGAEQIDVIAHSMGVTLGRRALKGGWHLSERSGGGSQTHSSYDLGDPLTDKVAHFIAIVGPNYGVLNCSE